MVPPHNKLIIAAATWLRVKAEAQQPSETKSAPIRMIPRKVLAATPGSNAVESLAKWRTMSKQASRGNQAMV